MVEVVMKPEVDDAYVVYCCKCCKKIEPEYEDCECIDEYNGVYLCWECSEEGGKNENRNKNIC